MTQNAAALSPQISRKTMLRIVGLNLADQEIFSNFLDIAMLRSRLTYKLNIPFFFV